jgi:hypothetical protein
MQTVVRKLTRADAAAFQSLRLQSLRERPSAAASSYEEECELALSAIAERFELRSDRAVFAALLGRDLVGFFGRRRDIPRTLATRLPLRCTSASAGNSQDQ